MSEGYDKSKDKVLFKEGINVRKQRGERFLNVVVYSYDGGEPKIRIQVTNKNTNPNASDKQKWVNQKGLSSIDKAEAEALLKALEKAIYKMK
jgi:hypothetical protein